MKCPVDEETLVMTDRNGVEIDYCPKCRGVWLDRGELDKIIERSASAAPAQSAPQAREPRREERHHDDRRYDDRRRYKKRESFLSELFDF
jgi:Zn-finger nucleic acid-binding protein